MIYWITGKAGAGKTVRAYKLAMELIKNGEHPIILDGDNVREWFPAGFSDEQREEHIMRIAKIAGMLEQQDFPVIVALVSPKKAWRQAARAMFEYSELIYVEGGTLWPGTTYEEPDEEEL